MKAKYLLVALLSLALYSCDDNSGSLGLGMFPSSDQEINGKLETFQVSTKSEISKGVFAKTSIGYLGWFTDPNFGFYESSFLAQLHCIENFEFPKVCDINDPESVKDPKAIMVKDDIYRAELLMTYSSYFGDSLTASRMSIYRLMTNLDKNEIYYTDKINTNQYIIPENLLGRKAYTAIDLSVSDSIRKLSTYVPSVTVTMPLELGKELYRKSRDLGKENFYKNFQNIFKGLYIKNDYGYGTILYIDQIELRIIYQVYVRNSSTGEILKTHNDKDSTAYSYRTFAATKEVIQANSFQNDNDLIQKKVNETEWTYLKTPAGIHTQATLPLDEIEKKLSQDTLSVSKLIFSNYNQSADNNKYAVNMDTPKYVLLVREQDREKFFKDNMINDNITSYISRHNAISSNQYVFSNLSQLINICLAEKTAAKIEAGSNWDEVKWKQDHPMWDKVAIIPVLVNSDSNGNIVSVQNDLRPGYAKLKGGKKGSKLNLDVTYTSFK